MRKFFFSFLLICLLGNFLIVPVLADDNLNPSLSDAVYADLAVRNYLDNVSVSFYDGKPDNAININETRHWLPASTVKLFAAMYAFKLISENKIHLYDTITIDSKNVVPTELVTDEFPTIQEGYTLTLDRLIRQMITQSDNTAFNQLLDLLNRKDITDYIHSLDLAHSAVGSKLNLDTSQEQYEFDAPGYGINTTTSDDYSKAFTYIWQDRIPGAQPLLEILKQQKLKYMLPLLLPKDAVVANKTGDLDPLFHDGGIIFGPKTSYVLSIFTNAGDPNLVAHISQLVYTKDYSLVGATIPNVKNTISDNPPLDPLVAEGKILPNNVLGAQTETIQTQPITASDLGITAKDLSFTQPGIILKNVFIPADSPWHILVPAWQMIKKGFALGPKGRSSVDLETTQNQISEARDLVTRGKTDQASTLLKNVQESISAAAKLQSTKNDTVAQTTLQAVSETRFQVFADALKTAKGSERNKLIREIGQQAKNTISQVQPNIPLASNAANPTQKPLIGEIVDKTDSSIVVKTAGGQEITIPLTDQELTVKTKEVSQIVPSLSPTTTETLSPSQTPVPTEKPTLASAKIGTTVALVGSSVGNTFTPTFALLNVPKELAAPEPVTVVKVNKKDHTMVISENGIPVQVNVNNKTSIRGSDTNVSFNEIKPGDVVIVHGEPLTPVIPTKAPSAIPSPTQNTTSVSPQISTTQTPAKTTSNSGTVSPTATNSQAPISPSISSTQNITPTKNITSTQTQQNGQTTSPKPSIKTSQAPQVISQSQTATNSKTTSSTQAPQSGQTNIQKAQIKTPQTTTTAPQSQPKVIQSTSIQIIEKKEDAGKTHPSSNPQPQPQSQPKQEQKPQSQPAQEKKPDSQPPAVQTNPTTKTKSDEKKK